MAARVTALMAAFIPGASPPEVSTPIVLILAICTMFTIAQNYKKSTNDEHPKRTNS
jgi:hypothetical protein